MIFGGTSKNKITDCMENRSIVSIADYGKEKIQYLLDMAAEFEAHPNRQILKGIL